MLGTLFWDEVEALEKEIAAYSQCEFGIGMSSVLTPCSWL
jgi:hypothetical protein